VAPQLTQHLTELLVARAAAPELLRHTGGEHALTLELGVVVRDEAPLEIVGCCTLREGWPELTRDVDEIGIG
jgi:hypothetical protein